MLWNIIGAAAFAALVLLLVWAVRGLMLTPVRPGTNTRLTVRLDVSGGDASLESAVSALEWLSANGTLPCGMDEATLAVAEALERDGRITIIREGN